MCVEGVDRQAGASQCWQQGTHLTSQLNCIIKYWGLNQI